MRNDLALSAETHDFILSENNDLIIIGNAEQIAQQIKCRLQFWLGEWFLDNRKGLPYLDDVIIKKYSLQQIRAIFKAQIIAIEGVEKVNSLTLDLNRKTRILEVDFEVTTSYGLITRKEVLEYV